MPKDNILPLSRQSPKESQSYFFDANAWIYVIESSSKSSHKPYINFFHNLVGFIDDFDRRKKQSEMSGAKMKPGKFDEAKRPKIILTPLLISEMFNVLIRKRHNEYCNKNGHVDFKRDYRGSEDYVETMKLLRSELFNYKQYYQIIDDKADSLCIEQILEQLNYKMDFNDLCYYYTCYNHNYILVTNDRDFKVEYVTVYTELSALLSN